MPIAAYLRMPPTSARRRAVASAAVVLVALLPTVSPRGARAADPTVTTTTTAPPGECPPPSLSTTTTAPDPACPPPCPSSTVPLVAPKVEEIPDDAETPSEKALAGHGTPKQSGKDRAQRVNAIVAVGDTAYLGGEFTKMVSPSGSSSSRGYLASIDGRTGKLTSWNPKADGKVWAMELAADGKSVYVGGDFYKIGDKSVPKLARVDLATGKVVSTFKPKSVKGRVRAIALDGDRLYIGGEFEKVDGQPRPKLAALDATTGALLDWMPPALGPGRYLTNTGVPTVDYAAGHVFAVDVIGSTVYAGGTFLNLGCRAALVALDSVTGQPAKLQYEPNKPVFDLEAYGGMLYAVSGGPGGRVYAYGPDSRWPEWRAKFDGDAVGLAVSNSTVYVAGHYDHVVSEDSDCYQDCPDGPRRRHLSSFSRADGELQAWDPEADTSTGPYTAAVGATTLFVGGEFLKINGKAQPGFAVFPGTP